MSRTQQQEQQQNETHRKLKERIEGNRTSGRSRPSDKRGRGGGLPNPEIRGEGADLKKKFFSALRALVSSKNKGAPGPPPGSATENVRFSFRSSGRTKSFQKARLGGMGFSVTNFDHTKRVSVDSWKTRTYGLRISKWKAGVRSFLIRNHLFPLEVIKPSPVKEKREIFVPHNKDPILVTLLKMRPYYSQSSRENTTPSSDISPLASWATVSVPECNHAEKSHTCQFFRCFCLPYLQDHGLLGSTNFATLARW